MCIDKKGEARKEEGREVGRGREGVRDKGRMQRRMKVRMDGGREGEGERKEGKGDTGRERGGVRVSER